MPDDLRALLADADGGPAAAVDVDAIVDRGERLRRRRIAGRVASVVAVAVLVGSAAGAVLQISAGPAVGPVGRVPGGADAPSGAASSEETPSAPPWPAPGPSATFDPSSFTDEEHEKVTVEGWYLSAEEFESRVDDPEAMCLWAHQVGDDLLTELRPYGVGLSQVVSEYCGLSRPSPGDHIVYSEPQFDPWPGGQDR